MYLSGKNITETAIAIFFAFLPIMFLIGLSWFFIITDANKARDYLAGYQRIARSQQEQIKELQEEQQKEKEQDNWIEIHRAQLSQLKPAKRK